MDANDEKTYSAFAGERLIACGDLRTVLTVTKGALDDGEDAPLLIFEDQTGKQVDFDFRGTPAEVVARALEPAPVHAGPGRPKLGVVSREVSLLPRHWEWLEKRPEGISAALRRLVDDARKKNSSEERARAWRDAASRFMWSMAGNYPGFEEATRALFAKDDARLERMTRRWPEDVRRHVDRLVGEARRFEKTKRGSS